MADHKVWQLCGIIQLRQSEIPANPNDQNGRSVQKEVYVSSMS